MSPAGGAFGALEASGLGVAMRQWLWLYPSVEIVHIAGIGLLFGSIAVLDLRLLGFSRSIPVKKLSAHVLPWSIAAFVLIVPSGLLMFAAHATEFIDSEVFVVKMLLIMAGVLNAALFHTITFRTADVWDTEEMRKLRESAIELFAQGRVREVIEPNVALAFHPDNAARLADDYLRFVLAAGAEQLIRQNRAVIARPDARQHLAQVRCPVLVMCGEADQLTPPEHSREIAQLCPHSRLVMVPKCGHMLTMEQPEVVNAALRDWIQSAVPAVGAS